MGKQCLHGLCLLLKSLGYSPSAFGGAASENCESDRFRVRYIGSSLPSIFIACSIACFFSLAPVIAPVFQSFTPSVIRSVFPPVIPPVFTTDLAHIARNTIEIELTCVSVLIQVSPRHFQDSANCILTGTVKPSCWLILGLLTLKVSH